MRGQSALGRGQRAAVREASLIRSGPRFISLPQKSQCERRCTSRRGPAGEAAPAALSSDSKSIERYNLYHPPVAPRPAAFHTLDTSCPFSISRWVSLARARIPARARRRRAPGGYRPKQSLPTCVAHRFPSPGGGVSVSARPRVYRPVAGIARHRVDNGLAALSAPRPRRAAPQRRTYAGVYTRAYTERRATWRAGAGGISRAGMLLRPLERRSGRGRRRACG